MYTSTFTKGRNTVCCCSFNATLPLMMWYYGLSQINRDLLYFTFIPVLMWGTAFIFYAFNAGVCFILWSVPVWYDALEICTGSTASSKSIGSHRGLIYFLCWELSYTKVAVYFKVKQLIFSLHCSGFFPSLSFSRQ